MSRFIVTARWVIAGVDGDRAMTSDNGALLVDDNTIAATGTLDQMRAQAPGAPVIRYPHHVMVPGFVNSHHHVGLTPLQRGAPDLPLELWGVSRMSARPVDPYLDTLYSAFEMIASGVTTVGHIQSRGGGTPEAIHATATAVLDAYRAIGLRVSFSYPLIDQNRIVYEDDSAFCARLPVTLGSRLAELLRERTLSVDDYFALVTRLRADNSGQRLSRIQLAPANLHWCSDDALLRIGDVSRALGMPMHMHLLETIYQKEYALRRTGGKSAIRHLADLGLLGPQMTLGHGVWLTADDIDIVADSGTCICHNCSSNLRLRSGIAPLKRFMRAGIPLALGIDEAGLNDDRDMLQEIRLVLNLHRAPGMVEDAVPAAAQVLRMATQGGGASTAFAGSIGRLEPGYLFDAVVFDWDEITYPHQDASLPLLDVLLRRARTSANRAVYVDGRLIYDNGRFLNIDRAEVLERLAANLAQPADASDRERGRFAAELMPHVRRFYDDWRVPLDTSPGAEPALPS